MGNSIKRLTTGEGEPVSQHTWTAVDDGFLLALVTD